MLRSFKLSSNPIKKEKSLVLCQVNKHEEEKALHPTRREISLLQGEPEGADDSRAFDLDTCRHEQNKDCSWLPGLKEKIIISSTIRSPLDLLVKVWYKSSVLPWQGAQDFWETDSNKCYARELSNTSGMEGEQAIIRMLNYPWLFAQESFGNLRQWEDNNNVFSVQGPSTATDLLQVWANDYFMIWPFVLAVLPHFSLSTMPPLAITQILDNSKDRDTQK